MHHGVYIGKYAASKSKRILILGESHHTNDSDNKISGIPASYTTASVVEEYFLNPEKQSLHFFAKIANSFGFSTNTAEERLSFWENVYFGNYVDVLCGVGDEKANNQIKANRKLYNDELFTFINENSIDIVCCFGRSVFNALPSLADKKAEAQGKICEDIYIGKTKDFIALCTYMPHTAHKGTSVELKKSVRVYSLRHPSAQGGYSASNYLNILNSVWNEAERADKQ